MKKNLLIYLLPFILITGCKLDEPDFSNIGNISLTDTYQPLTKGSYWKYNQVLGTTTITSTNTITGATETINNKIYHTINSLAGDVSGTGYFYADNHEYILRSTSVVQDVTVDLLYLNDTTAVGHSWTRKITDDGFVQDVPGRIVGKVIEKDISKVVSGHTFTNVIHTSIDLQYDDMDNGVYNSYGLYDYYIAKGVGIIEIDSKIFGFTASSLLSSYSIK